MLVSFVIVTWNNEDELLKCLESIEKCAKETEFEIIITDNASTDDTINLLNNLKSKNYKINYNSENEGYTKGVNKGLKQASGIYVYLLNPDTVLTENSLAIMTEFMNTNNDYGACCPILLNEDGSIQNSLRNFPTYETMFYEFTLMSYIFPKSKRFGKWKMKYFKYDKDEDVMQPMAAALMIRNELARKLNYMDERFIMFFNDVDLCRRIIDKGFKIRLLSNAKVYHKKGASVYKDRVRLIDIWNKDCIRYFEKYYNKNSLFSFTLNISGTIRKSLYKIFK